MDSKLYKQKPIIIRMDFGFAEVIPTALALTKVVYIYKILFNNKELENDRYVSDKELERKDISSLLESGYDKSLLDLLKSKNYE